MPAVESTDAVRRQLERVLESQGFTRNDRLSRFLRFVVERHLEGSDHELKESVIATEVFGRKPDYNPKRDPVVRTEAGRLRARLSEYYIGEGSGDSLLIEMPKGGYTPVFRPLVGSPNRSAGRATGSRLRLAGAALGVMLAVIGWWWFHRENVPIAIAVLPLENLSHDPADDYFADGLTDELIRNLSVIDGLAPRSRTSSFAFKGKPRNVREVGKQLEADYILEGSVLRAGKRVRINAQLVRVRDDLPLWSTKFDREWTDVLAIQDEISRGIVNSLRLKLGRGRRRYETSPEAYDLYLRARALELRSGLMGVNQIIGPFEQVIARDPSFAPAYAGLAAAYAARSGEFPLRNEISRMRPAAEKAIQLDPLSAEAHDALGMVYAREAQWEQSERAFRRAVELDPSRSEAYGHFAWYLLLPLGRIEEALHQMRIAEKVDPLSPEVQDVVAYLLISVGRYKEAAQRCENLPADYVAKTECLGRALLGQGRTGEAILVLAKSSRKFHRAYLGHVYGRVGRREEAEKLAAAASPNPFLEALIFAGLGDKNRTLEALDRMATTMGPVRVGRALNDPEFALLRGDARVKALRRKAGLPE